MVFTFCARATVMHASANANAAKRFVFFMIYSSPSPPLRKSVKDALLEAGLLTYGQNAGLLSAPSGPIGDSGFSVADFVAVYSCEGSGGFTPHFPYASGASR